uniref:C-type lectin domain-containing protein n=1 Tax=Salarias fasciatus TaxID=181472 RepID=A0A672FE40_SALFA
LVFCSTITSLFKCFPQGKCHLFLQKLGFGITSCLESFHRKYHYVNQKMTWTDAQSYCREKYNDLATFESMEDIEKLSRPNMDNDMIWMGLYDDPNSWIVNLGNDTNSWRWSATETTSRTGYDNWSAGQPNYDQGKDLCVRMLSGGSWTDTFCTEERYFACYEG